MNKKKDKKEDCQHEKFWATVKVVKLTTDDNSKKKGGYMATVEIKCSECEQQFGFIGAPIGSSFTYPTMSLNGKELRVPIESLEDRDKSKIGSDIN